MNAVKMLGGLPRYTLYIGGLEIQLAYGQNGFYRHTDQVSNTDSCQNTRFRHCISWLVIFQRAGLRSMIKVSSKNLNATLFEYLRRPI